MRLHDSKREGSTDEKLSVEEKASPFLGEYFKFFEKRAAQEGYGATASGIARMALDEMWRRRNEPDPRSAQSLVRFGVSSAVENFYDIDFSKAIIGSKSLFVQTSSLDTFLSKPATKSALLARLATNRQTSLILRSYPYADNRFTLSEADQLALFQFLRIVGRKRLENIRILNRNEDSFDPFRRSEVLTLCGKYVSNATSFEEIFWTDEECYVATRYDAATEIYPAIRYVPSLEPTPFEVSSTVHTEMSAHPVTVSGPSLDFHNRTRTQMLWNVGGFAHNITEQLFKSLLDAPNPTPLITGKPTANEGG